MRHGYACYPADPEDRIPPVVTVDPPVRTPQVGNVRLTTNEPATIYYAYDGSHPSPLGLSERDQVVIPDLADNATVSFFAVDLNGNASPLQTVAWQIDRNGPGTPTGFKLTLAGTKRTLAWVPPPDPHLRGVLVARVEGLLNFSPERGKKYNLGDTLAPGVKVVSIVANGFSGAFTEDVTTHTVGLVRYAAWSFDDLYNYGSPANAYAVETLPTQTASLSVDSATGAVSVTAQPANIALAGTAALDGSTLRVTLDVTNNTSRVLFAPKMLLTTPPATGSLNDDGTLDTFSYRALGGALLPGVKLTTTLDFSGVTGGDVLAMGFELRTSPIAVAGAWSDSSGSAVDEATQQVVVTLAAGPSGPSGEISMHGGGATVDGRFIMGGRTSSELTSFDLSKGRRLLSRKLAVGKAHIPRLALDASTGTGYALVAGGHSYTTQHEGIATQLVVFDTATLVETARVDLGASRNRSIEVSPDGKRLAVATGTDDGVILVELGDLTVRHIATQFAPFCVSFTADSSTLVVTNTFEVALITIADGKYIKQIPLPPATKSFTGAFGADGRYWLGREGDVVAVNLSTGVLETFTFDAAILHVWGDKIYVMSEGDSSVTRLKTTGEIDDTPDYNPTWSFDDGVYGHWMGHSPF